MSWCYHQLVFRDDEQTVLKLPTLVLEGRSTVRFPLHLFQSCTIARPIDEVAVGALLALMNEHGVQDTLVRLNDELVTVS
jgi:hypothetical protein